jgi:hypothetical protein
MVLQVCQHLTLAEVESNLPDATIGITGDLPLEPV